MDPPLLMWHRPHQGPVQNGTASEDRHLNLNYSQTVRLVHRYTTCKNHVKFKSTEVKSDLFGAP